MKLEVLVNKENRSIELTDQEGNAVLTCLDDGRTVPVDVRRVEPDVWSLLINGESYECTIQPIKDLLRVTVRGATWDIQVYDPRRMRAGGGLAGAVEGEQVIVSPMPGRIVRVEVAVGDEVEAGQGLIVVEAMKMENELTAASAGTVKEIKVEAGQTVESDQALLTLE